MKYIVLGTTEFTIFSAQALIDCGQEICALISMPKKKLPLNSADIASFSKSNKIPYYEIGDINSKKSQAIIKRYNPDYILSSWPKLIEKKIINIPKYFCIGSHPTDLPFNRGRHPLHWLIAMGIKNTKLTFFILNENIDSGNVLLKVPFEVKPERGIDAAIYKMNQSAYEGVRRLSVKLCQEPKAKGIKQNRKNANYWRMRTSHDATLDLRMSKDKILHVVNSFSPPYPRVNLIFENYLIKIFRAAKSKKNISSLSLQSMEPGKILNVNKHRITVKVDDGLVDLESKNALPNSLKRAKYIHPPSKYILRWSKELAAKLR